METSIKLDPKTGITCVKTSGEADAASSGGMIGPIVAFMRQHSSLRCLIDHTDLTIVTGKTIEIYRRPLEMHKSGMPFDVRIAAVIQKAYEHHFSFLETVSVNNGLSYKVFYDLEEAKAWLLE